MSGHGSALVQTMTQMDARASVQSAKHRTRLRFSLLTLTSFVLTLGAGATLCWNWGAVYPAYTVRESGGGAPDFFSPNDRYSFHRSYVTDLTNGRVQYEFTVRATDSGKLVYTFPERIPDGETITEYFSPSERYLIVERKPPRRGPFDSIPLQSDRRTDIVELQSAKIISLHDRFGLRCSISRISGNEILLVQNYDEVQLGYNLVALPSMEVLAEFKGGDFFPSQIAADGNWVLGTTGAASVGNHRSFACYSVSSKGILPFASMDGFYEMDFCCDEKCVAVSTNNISTGTPITTVYEIATRAPIAIFDGRAESKRNYGGGQFYPPLASDRKHILTMRRQNSDTWISDYTIGCIGPGKPRGIDVSGDTLGFTDREGCLAFRQPFGAWDADRNVWLWRDDAETLSPTNGHLAASGHWIAYNREQPKSTVVVSATTGQLALQFPNWRWRETAQPATHDYVCFANQHSFFLTHNSETKDGTTTTAFTLWRQRRPLEWYGVACLLEFWIAVVLVALLIWSGWRDLRSLRMAARPESAIRKTI